MDFQTLLAGLVSGALTVPIVGWILQQFPDIEIRRTVAIVASFLLGTGAFLLSGYLGYTELPADLKTWLEALWPVWGAAFTASQMVLSAYRSTSGN